MTFTFSNSSWDSSGIPIPIKSNSTELSNLIFSTLFGFLLVNFNASKSDLKRFKILFDSLSISLLKRFANLLLTGYFNSISNWNFYR